MTEGTAERRAAHPRAASPDEWPLRLAFLVTTTGDWIYRFALPLLVLELTGSATSTAITYALEFIPFVLIGVLAGNFADRADRRRLLVSCDLSSAVIVGGLAVIAVAEVHSVALIYGAALALAAIRPFSFPAFQGFIVERVPVGRRPGVNAWVQAAESVLSMLGPVVGIGIVVWMGPAAACTVNAVSFLGSALLITRTRRRPHPGHWLGGVWGNVRRDVADGVRVLVGVRPLLWGTILMTGTNFAVMSVEANLPFLLTADDDQSSWVLVAVFAAQGVGAVLGAAAAPRIVRTGRTGHAMSCGMVLLAVAFLLPVAHLRAATLVPAWLLVGLATSLIVVPWFTWRQAVVPEAVIGRVTSVSRAVSYVTMPIGAWVGALVLTQASARLVFVVAAVAQGLIWLGTIVSPLRRAGGVQPIPPTCRSRSAEPLSRSGHCRD